jgi:hypothetical protein
MITIVIQYIIKSNYSLFCIIIFVITILLSLEAQKALVEQTHKLHDVQAERQVLFCKDQTLLIFKINCVSIALLLISKENLLICSKSIRFILMS